MTGIRIALAALVALLLFQGAATAHELEQSYIFLRIESAEVSGRFEANVSDLNDVLGTGFRTDGTVTSADVDARIDKVRAYLDERLRISTADGPAEIRLGAHGHYDLSFAQFVTIEFELGEFAEQPKHLDVDYTGFFDRLPDHRGMLVIEHFFETGTFNNEAIVALTFGPDETRQRLDLSESSRWRGFVSMVKLGIHHIWIGIDHILFLLALLLPAVLLRRDGGWEPVPKLGTALWQVVKVVTIFTIAHSVTLSLAALDLVNLPSRLVESVIAISIAAAAVYILVPVFRAHVWWVVAAFGLFHGFGFAGVLGEMGMSGSYMTLTLLGFNVGVEIGQVAIICIAFPVLFLIRTTRLYTGVMVKCGAVLLVLVSLYWFTERAFEVDLPAGEWANWVLGRGN